MARGTWGGTLDPNIWKVNIRFYMGSSQCQTGFKLRDVALNDNTGDEVAEEVRTQLEIPFRGLLKTSDGMIGVDTVRLGAEEGGWAPSTTQAGTLTPPGAAALPDFVSVNVSMKSEIRKRYGQGRFFLPETQEGGVDGNQLSNDGVARIQAYLDVMAAHFMGDPVTHDLLLVNAHPLLPAREAPGSPGYRPEIPASWYDVVSLRINPIVTSLRSRKSGVGS
jgi:hypothetical protein